MQASRARSLVADNGSTDGSQAIATALGARVVPVAVRGYGGALAGGIAAARGRYVIMGDADDSYDLRNLDAFLAELRGGRRPRDGQPLPRRDRRRARCRSCTATSAIRS